MYHTKRILAVLFIFSLSGTAIASAYLQISESNYNYGNVDAGSNTDHSFTLTNTGDADYQLDGIEIMADSHSAFSIISGGIRISITLHPGDTHTFTVRFSPPDSGLMYAAVFIFSQTDPLHPNYFISLAGLGIGTEQNIFCYYSSHTFNFGNTAVGSAKVYGFTFGNAGHTNLSITATTIEGTDASQFQITAGGGPRTLGMGETFTVQISFMPSSKGTKYAVLKIASSDPDENPYSISLTGTGMNPVQDLDTPVSPFDFGVVNPGLSAATGLYLQNNGMTTLTVSAATLTGTHASEFSMPGAAPPFDILPCLSSVFIIYFSPSGTGRKTATLRISSNDPDENPFDIHLTGTGAGPDLEIIQVTFLGRNGQDIQYKMTIHNRGSKATAAEFKNRIYLSSDQTITNSDYLISDWNIDATIASGESRTSWDITTTVTGVPEGRYYLGAITDAKSEIQEENETNNTGCSGDLITITPVTGSPDIHVEPDSLSASDTATLQLHIGNTGDADLTFSIDDHNLIESGGFENGLEPWVEEDHLNTGTLTLDSTNAHCGKYALKAVAETSVEGHQFQLKQTDFPIENNHDYLLSFWGMAGSAKQLAAVICREIADWNPLSEYHSIYLTTDWQYFIIPMHTLIPEGLPNPLPPEETRLSIQRLGSGTAAVWLDDIRLQNPENFSGWLNFGINSGVVKPGEDLAVDVIFNAGSCPDGMCVTDIMIQSNDPDEPAITIPVQMDASSGSGRQSGGIHIPRVFTLFQNHPNPFNASTVIRYAVPKPGFISLTIQDSRGRKAATLVNEFRNPGEYSVIWDGKDYPNGIYICRLQAGRTIKTRKMVLMK